MAGKLGQEARLAIKVLKERRSSARSIPRTLEVTEGAVRYYLRRHGAGGVDGRSGNTRKAAHSQEVIATWLANRSGDAISLTALHAWLVVTARGIRSTRSSAKQVHLPTVI